jgi:hypothetical protein
MKINQVIIRPDAPFAPALSPLAEVKPDLVLVFGSRKILTDPHFVPALQQVVPAQVIAGCSTAGEIHKDEVTDESCVISALTFDQTKVQICESVITDNAGSHSAGKALADQLRAAQGDQSLAAVLVFSRGTAINGSALIEGMHESLGADLPIFGGLAGDDGAFERTYTISPSGLCDDRVIAAGLYGDTLSLAYGSAGGWEAFGPTRRITACDGNVLYSLDGEPALDIYRRYLGDYAKDLPASGLLFPFEMLSEQEQSVGLIRTILGIDEEARSLILAGSVDPNGYLRMMHSNTDKLIDGAENAATLTGVQKKDGATFTQPTLGILVSCVGRKLVMGDRVDEEVEAVSDLLAAHLGHTPTLTGFYSYGEITPYGPYKECSLHNQTMTIALISENLVPQNWA